MAHFVEVVFVQLAHEAREVAVLEVLGKDVLGELLVLYPVSVTSTFCLQGAWHTSRTTKLSPSFPQRTTLSSCGFSSILLGFMSVSPGAPRLALSRVLVELANLRAVS